MYKIEIYKIFKWKFLKHIDLCNIDNCIVMYVLLAWGQKYGLNLFTNLNALLNTKYTFPSDGID